MKTLQTFTALPTMTRTPLHAHAMKRFALVLLALGIAAPVAPAQQQFQGLCSRVKMVIEQELTLERIGFEAQLEVTNNDGEDPITDFFAELSFENPLYSTNGATHDASALFFVRAPTFERLNAVDGTGVIAPGVKAVARWFIIPKIAAGGSSPDGVRYRVGCNLSGKIRGAAIPKEIMFAVPDTITVKPDPQLDITYFQPRDVQGDDPFTPEVESPVPFTLGVLVKNSGYGPARKLKIDSKQPKIVENFNGLLLVAQLLGARVNDSPRSSSLLVDMGDIMPSETKKGAWDMITSLSGEFVEFRATYKHASELGGEETSVIKSLNAYFIAKEVLNDQPSRDGVKDFLADTVDDPEHIPDTLYESQGNLLPVYWQTNLTSTGAGGPGRTLQIALQSDIAGWAFFRIPDPGQDKTRLASVVRSDGKILNTNNVWTNHRYTPLGNIRQNWLNIFDLVDLGAYSYTVTYGAGEADTTPPVTGIYFAGAVNEAGGKHYITPDTQIYFISEDASPVSIVYSLTNGPYVPALPFRLPNPGEYQIAYKATDSFNNEEAPHTNILVVSGSAALDFAAVSAPAQTIFAAGDALSVRPSQAPITFRAQPNPAAVSARVDVFQGVVGWATLSGIPSSPTAATTASLTVGGANVDLYKYRLDGGAWSAERPVSTPIALSGLSAAPHTVAVLGRSASGGYLAESNATLAAWTVSPTAPATRLTGAPAQPMRGDLVSLTVSGTGVTDYRWMLDVSYYRAQTPAATPLIVSSLTPGAHEIRVIGKVGAAWEPTNNPATVFLTVDPNYGYDHHGLPLVQSVAFTNIGTNALTFSWDGRDTNGAVMPRGSYTARLTLSDSLGRSNFTTRVLQIGDLGGASSILADTVRGPKNPHARGRWAVWQDQSDGNWQIYAQDLNSGAAPVTKITASPLAQENPRTDGRYVVWQSRQTNGNWDIYLKDLAAATPPQALTTNLALDEIAPAIDWPWVVYQAKSTANPGAPWLLRARNLATGQSSVVQASTQDQLNADVQAGRVVWEDYRDVGWPEIYYKDLESGETRRITTNSFGQYHPVIFDHWIVWDDNRNGGLDLYGYDLLRRTELQLTRTPENESRPFIDGPWVVCAEDSLGVLTRNVRLLHLPSQRLAPITRNTTAKERPALAGTKAVWLDVQTNQSRVLVAELPSLQAVFQNRNTVVVTEAMATYQQNAHSLLRLWHDQAGVQEITRYTALTPAVVSETAAWSGGAPSGPNFALVPGTFLWIKFDAARVLDLGLNPSAPVNLAAGVNMLSYSQFPSQYSAYRLLGQLGAANARAVRMLDAESGRWAVALMQNGQPIGHDFVIPKVAVLLLDLANAVSNFKPQ